MLRAGRDFEFFNPYAAVDRTKANLPHWRQPRALYFVTFRQADSIPQEKLREWQTDYDNWLAHNPKPWNEKQFEEYLDRFARPVERWLDGGHGSCRLRSPPCRKIVEDEIYSADGESYRLDEYTVAANHVHVLVSPSTDSDLSSILKQWKGASSKALNDQFNRTGTFWQKEYYDHIVRNETALYRMRRYIQRHTQ